MHNPTRPSIAQPSRKSRLKSTDGQDAGKVQLTMPKAAEAPPKPGFAPKAPEPAPDAPAAVAATPPTPVATLPAPVATPPAPVAAVLAPVPVVPPVAAVPVSAPAAVTPPAPVAPTPTPAAPLLENDTNFQLPAGFKPKSKQPSERLGNTRNTPASPWRTLVFPALLLVGGIAGYLVGFRSHPPAPAATAATASKPAPGASDAPDGTAPAITAEQQSQLDAAYEAMKDGKYPIARAQMGAILEKRPDWTSLRFEIARIAFYQRDYSACEKLVRAGENNGEISIADGEFLLALQQMTNRHYQIANKSYERAVSADPARADIYYFWGECLRRQGKPGEASAKFRAARSRNQYETAETLYELKLWLSEVQAGEETKNGLAAKLDEEMAGPNPSSAVLLASAARAIKAGQFAPAASLVSRGRQLLDPAVFNVVIQDPTFAQEGWRPEFAGFYPKPAPPPVAPSPTAKETPAALGENASAPPDAAAPKPLELAPPKAAESAAPDSLQLAPPKMPDAKGATPAPQAPQNMGGQVPPRP